MKVLIIGDVVGRLGRRALTEFLPSLHKEYGIDFVIANGENAAGGFGLTIEVSRELFQNGVDLITSGNHIWDKKEIYSYLEEEERILRPANYPQGTPGKSSYLADTSKGILGVLNLEGRVFMGKLECPFRTGEKIIEELRQQTKMIIVDFHAEATSEKIALGYFLDGKVSAVVGTHTHVLTADEKILHGGTAYITDIGMTGPYDSVIGIKKEIIIKKYLTQLPAHFEVNVKGPYMLNGVLINIDPDTGKALSIQRIHRVSDSSSEKEEYRL